ncbi:hypothetical protein Franean1_5455 [Parafrankia sp. EAN1pec]|nr:hypothetical protein Franean1_5455 [Frankia sp. EAN1pec]
MADGRFTEGRFWLARTLGHTGNAPRDQVRAVHTAGWLAILQGDLPAAG